MFSEESHFSVIIYWGHQLLWRERGTRYSQKFVCERDLYYPDVMLWAAILHNGRTQLHMSELGSVTSQWYFRKVVLDHIRIFRGAVGSDFLFMEDNAWAHRSVEVPDTLQYVNIHHTHCPAYSPNLNPIKYAWNALRRRFAQRIIPPHTVQELKTTFRKTEDNAHQGLLDCLVMHCEQMQNVH
ncbi:transposable element Tcb2 transposase [Trichonephila clavipes]|nr:transposable element Tcb2 transposase [Trichonephila clavipes]